MNRGLLKQLQDGGPLRTHPYANTLQDGGEVSDTLMLRFKRDVESNDTSKKRARLYYYKQLLDTELARKNPEAWSAVQTQYPASKSVSDRTEQADKLINDNSFAYALNGDEVRNILGEKYEDFSALRTWSADEYDVETAGMSEQGVPTDLTKYGLRNSWAIPKPTRSRTYDTKPYIVDEADIEYNPLDDSYSYKYSRVGRSEASKAAIKKKLQTQTSDEFNRTPRFEAGGLLKMGGKVGDPKNRSKAGGSNVGKYSESEGSFAGPSGGAPSGSYPIGSKARGKSALKLAHNAPNPSGIKKAVYRKYPDLKPEKAVRGSKLGMNEVGVLQGSYPIAPPARRYLLARSGKKKR